MKKIFSKLFVILISCISVIAQDKSECPSVKILSPSKAIAPGIFMRFAVSLDKKNVKLEYNWLLSNDEIHKGQGTPAIVVNIKGLENTTITAYLEIKGLPQNCRKFFFGDGLIDSRQIGDIPLEYTNF